MDEVLMQAFVWGRDDHRSGYFGDVAVYVGNVFGVGTTDEVRLAYVDGHKSLGCRKIGVCDG